MTVLTLELDNKVNENILDLMKHYRVNSKAEILTKGLALLKIAKYVDETDGEIFARKGSHETKLIIR